MNKKLKAEDNLNFNTPFLTTTRGLSKQFLIDSQAPCDGKLDNMECHNTWIKVPGAVTDLTASLNLYDNLNGAIEPKGFKYSHD